MSEPIRMDGQYQTRDGRYRQRILCVDAKGGQPVVALLEDEDGCEFLRRYNADGVYLENGRQGPLDLVPVPKKHKVWVNFYRSAHASREAADKFAYWDRLACKEVEFTEGEGLSPPEEKQ